MPPSPTHPSIKMFTSSFYPLLFTTLLLLVLLSFLHLYAPPAIPDSPCQYPSRHTDVLTTRRHLFFSIAASSASLPHRLPYIRLWYSPTSTSACIFLDKLPSISAWNASFPPLRLSADTSRFPYSFPKGLRSAIRVARVVKEAVDLNVSDIRWYVFGDDDTVFFVDNLVRVLQKYDHMKWYYVGSNSESYDQNEKHSFDMAFGGGGFAISSSLANVLSRVLDSCLMRYGHLYGSDSRVYSCLAELGIGLTHEPGFHQVDMRGNLFGVLTAHPLSPLVSLHHLDNVDPVFPNMNKIEALEHLFRAANVDPARILQQIVCYDRSNLLTISVAWGYAIQVYEGNQHIPDLLSVQKTFYPWRRSTSANANCYIFNTRDYPTDPCKRPTIFFLESVNSDKNGARSRYIKSSTVNCMKSISTMKLEHIHVFSQKLEIDIEEMRTPRRQCCDVFPSSNESMVINVRKCGVDELISMHV